MAVATTESNQTIADALTKGKGPARLPAKGIETMIRFGEICNQAQAIAIFGLNPRLSQHTLTDKNTPTYGQVFIDLLTDEKTYQEKLSTFMTLRNMRFGIVNHQDENKIFYNPAKFINIDGNLVGSIRIAQLINCLHRTEIALITPLGGCYIFDDGNITGKNKFGLGQEKKTRHKKEETTVEQLDQLRIKPIESDDFDKKNASLHLLDILRGMFVPIDTSTADDNLHIWNEIVKHKRIKFDRFKDRDMRK